MPIEQQFREYSPVRLRIEKFDGNSEIFTDPHSPLRCFQGLGPCYCHESPAIFAE